jgi:hypothetical protein
MVRFARGHGRCVAIAAMCVVLALNGCGGGSVSVRSNFSGPPLGPAPRAAPPANAPTGLYAAGDGDVLLAIIVAMMLFDGVSWVSQRIRQALGEPEALPAAPAPPYREPPRRGSGASWVFSLP